MDHGAHILKPDHILLASHGTPGARAAERVALSLARACEARLTLLCALPDFWRDGRRPDGWLEDFPDGEATEMAVPGGELLREVRREALRVAAEARRLGVSLRIRARLGHPDETLLAAVADCEPGIVVIGAPRPRGMPGFRARMKPERLVRALPCPLLVVPNPLAAEVAATGPPH